MARAAADALAAALSAGGERALFFAGRWRSAAWIAASAAALSDALAGAACAGLVARNRPAHVAAFASGILAGRGTAMIYAAQSPAALAADIRRLRLPAIVADAEDWSDAALDAARETGSAAVAIGDGAERAEIALRHPPGPGPFAPSDAETALELLSSGTTGMPKRVALTWATVTRSLDDSAALYAGSAGAAPQIMVHPLASVSGLSYALPPLLFGQPLVLLEKFDASGWARAVREHRPARATVPPVGIAMLLDSDVPADWLASLDLVAVGGGRLEPERHAAFEARFGVPVLTAYGATEFAGVVAGWTLDLYRQWSAAKRGSAGRVRPGAALRVVGETDFAPLSTDATGLLEVRVERIGPDWIRTTDLASIDGDGFLYLHGRADDAINRGGFKIVPEVIAATLRTHPAVADAAVVGRADRRLGAVPVAAVELHGEAMATAPELIAFLAERLPAYQIPVDLRIVPALPRTASMKVALAEVKALLT